LQQIGAGTRLWWRATRSLVPQAGSLFVGARPNFPPNGTRAQRRRGQRWRLSSVVVLSAAVVLGAITLLIQTDPRGEGRDLRSLLAEAEKLAVMAGLGIEQVSVVGHRFTPDGDIFDALRLNEARSIVGFDSHAAQQRIEALPWVASASIARILPDRLEVVITERVAAAVWQQDGKAHLIDRTGRVLGVVGNDMIPDLPRIAGRGAPAQWAALLEVLEQEPQILERLEIAERIGERRWTLRLAGAVGILLPEAGERSALERLTKLELLRRAGRGAEIDLRVAHRILVREAATQRQDRT
jgi:cell division protein FtsQ